MNHQALSSFIWSVADLLRGDYKQSEYGKVILPFTVLRRLDCVLEATKADVLAEIEAKQSLGINLEPFLLRKSGASFYNSSPIDMKKLMSTKTISKKIFTAICRRFHLRYVIFLNALTSSLRLNVCINVICFIKWPKSLPPSTFTPKPLWHTHKRLHRVCWKFNETAGEH